MNCHTTVEAEVSFINIDDPKDKITIISIGYGIDPQDKGIGKAVSYATKYAYLKTFCLETGEDIERDVDFYNTVEEKSKDCKLPDKISQSQVFDIEKSIGRNKTLHGTILKKAGVRSLAEIPRNLFDKIMEFIESQENSATDFDVAKSIEKNARYEGL